MHTEDYIPEEQDNEELYEQYNILTDKGQSVLRIDKFLIDRIPEISRNRIQNLCHAECVLVNDKAVKPNYKVKPLDKIFVVLPKIKREIEIKAENIPLDIVFEDEELIVLNKPAGLVVHPGYGNYTGTLVNALMYHCKDLPSFQLDRPGIVHRLDKNTTGLMLAAKTEYSLNHLAKQFFNRTINRSYQAIIWGEPENKHGTIEGYIGRSLKNRKVMDVFDSEEMGKSAITHYEVLRNFGYVSLVKCKLETGRTHQIRVHLKHIGHPLFNDYEYGGDKILKGTTYTKYKQFIQNCFDLLPRQALHAKSIGFTHPKTGKEMYFDSELPKDMKYVIEKFERYTHK
jgi:23S rRNA pseudouridine1911/1915/1917 synthase